MSRNKIIQLGFILMYSTAFSGPSFGGWPALLSGPTKYYIQIVGSLRAPVEVTKSGDCLLNLAGGHQTVVTWGQGIPLRSPRSIADSL
jgi:hypothetical protein